MASYKEMYELLAYQSNQALLLLREAKIDKIFQAIDLLENAHKEAEQLYIDTDNTVPFVSLETTKQDDK